ncbi:peptidase inhibitor family I36 protein [Streptomyces sp. WAC 06738]|uniref:peptidase inhibitor family I36 protein n=1 Tax=Streptomyces sp. WAC 06738 TaxID=2203210 RepID=UPI0013DEF6B3|nr:peptidase inhibitor family I36 protein [Streptomyces sp. WAC 06738]
MIFGEGANACRGGRVCLYENFTLNERAPARILMTTQKIDWLGDYGFNDVTGSVCNFANYPVILYKDATYHGESVVFAVDECNDVPISFNDEAASLQFLIR